MAAASRQAAKKAKRQNMASAAASSGISEINSIKRLAGKINENGDGVNEWWRRAAGNGENQPSENRWRTACARLAPLSRGAARANAARVRSSARNNEHLRLCCSLRGAAARAASTRLCCICVATIISNNITSFHLHHLYYFFFFFFLHLFLTGEMAATKYEKRRLKIMA